MNVLTAHQLTIGYRRPERVVAAGLDLALAQGELVCLLGPNGAGKSTLMRTLAGMQPPLAGKITLQGDDLTRLNNQELARRLSLVLTEKVDVGTLPAYELVALGRYPYTDWAGRLDQEDQRVVQWAIKIVGAEALAQRYFHTLSDGEKQKIMIARALAQEPALIMLDEPTAFLDLPRRVEIMRTLRKLARETGRAVLLSTHDLDLALRSADKLWLLPMDGTLLTGAPEDLILNGAFERTFRSEGVEFDPHTGMFRMNVHTAGTIGLMGDGLPLIWMQRALEREGFTVQVGAPSACYIEVIPGGWRLHQQGSHKDYPTVYDVLQAIKHE